MDYLMTLNIECTHMLSWYTNLILSVVVNSATNDDELDGSIQISSLDGHTSEFIQYLSDSHQLIPGHLIQLAESIGQGTYIMLFWGEQA